MRTASKCVLVAAVTLCVAGLASAQNPGGGRGGRGGAGFGGGMMGGGVAQLLANEGVQKELKLTDEQKTKVKEFADAQRAKMADLRPQPGEQPDREKMQAAMKAATEASDKFVKDTLNADQQKRIKQIQYQAMGMRAFSNEDVAKALSLTDEQKEKIKTLGADAQKDMQDLRADLQGGGDAATEARKKMTSLNKEYLAKATDTLTADQKKTWKDMTGEPVDPSILQMQGGGRGNRGGAGGGAGGGRGGRGGNNPPPPPV
jgi:Spy/CpxP family protein refolding chaperone